eukprot:m.162221 g.162221  ORF g.162221 m.162221 type:complete len:487 (-) comp10296_c0_seq8:563-2023(-)
MLSAIAEPQTVLQLFVDVLEVANSDEPLVPLEAVPDVSRASTPSFIPAPMPMDAGAFSRQGTGDLDVSDEDNEEGDADQQGDIDNDEDDHEVASLREAQATQSETEEARTASSTPMPRPLLLSCVKPVVRSTVGTPESLHGMESVAPEHFLTPVVCEHTDCREQLPAKRGYLCARCLGSWYCSRECQVNAWWDGGHSEFCKMPGQSEQETRPLPPVAMAASQDTPMDPASLADPPEVSPEQAAPPEGEGSAIPTIPAIPTSNVGSPENSDASPTPPPNACRQFTIEVSRYLIEGHHAEYTISVTGVTNPESSWEISRRFSEFAKLHSLLRSNFPQEMSAIKFPSKSFTFRQNTLHESFISTRCALLDRYLQNILEAGLGTSIELREFVSPAGRMFPKPKGVSGVVGNVVGGVVAVANFDDQNCQDSRQAIPQKRHCRRQVGAVCCAQACFLSVGRCASIFRLSVAPAQPGFAHRRPRRSQHCATLG